MIEPDADGDMIKVPVRRPTTWEANDPSVPNYDVKLQTYNEMMKREHEAELAKREVDRMNKRVREQMEAQARIQMAQMQQPAPQMRPKSLDEQRHDELRLMLEGNVIVESPNVPEDQIYIVDKSRNDDLANGLRRMAQMSMMQPPARQEGEHGFVGLMRQGDAYRESYQGTVQPRLTALEQLRQSPLMRSRMMATEIEQRRLMTQGAAFGVKPQPKAEVEQVEPRSRRVRVA